MLTSPQALRYSRLISCGSYLPGVAVTNDALALRLAAQGVETSSDWIVERTGILQRYIAAPEENTSDLAIAAAKRALANAQLTGDQIDLIVLATSTPDQIFPSTACKVQHAIGAKRAPAFDVQAVCSGYVYALSIADAMIRTGAASKALVIGAETFSRILNWQDRTTCVLFGDGAGATVLVADDKPGVRATKLHSDGGYEHILSTPGSIANGVAVGYPFLKMDGQAVFKLAVQVLSEVAREVCDAANVSIDSVDWLIPHQANVRILNATAKRLGIGSERVISTVDQHANTSAASVPLALDTAISQGKIKSGQRLLLQGVGGGFTWGAALVDY
jgi:3-oxoacyl-[acyl-carrier-protein] synthase III